MKVQFSRYTETKVNNFKIGDTVECTMDNKKVTGIVAKINGDKIKAVVDSGQYEFSIEFFFFKKIKIIMEKDIPTVMDKWGVVGYKKGRGQETIRFQAYVTLNGKKVIDASNDGCGGCNRYHATGEDNFKAVAQFEKDAVEWAKKMGDKKPMEPDGTFIEWYVNDKPFGVTAKQRFLKDKKIMEKMLA